MIWSVSISASPTGDHPYRISFSIRQKIKPTAAKTASPRTIAKNSLILMLALLLHPDTTRGEWQENVSDVAG